MYGMFQNSDIILEKNAKDNFFFCEWISNHKDDYLYLVLILKALQGRRNQGGRVGLGPPSFIIIKEYV